MDREVRFWLRTNTEGPYHPALKSRCWEWMGSRMTNRLGNYGIVRWDGRNQPAHRIAWELTHGVRIPGRLVACHACDNPPCVNPDHIWIGTRALNAFDSSLKSRKRGQHRLEEAA